MAISTGAMLPDATLRVLGDLTRLKRLSLRSVRGFAGTGFGHYTLSQKHRDGPTEVDLLTEIRDQLAAR